MEIVDLLPNDKLLELLPVGMLTVGIVTAPAVGWA